VKSRWVTIGLLPVRRAAVAVLSGRGANREQLAQPAEALLLTRWKLPVLPLVAGFLPQGHEGSPTRFGEGEPSLLYPMQLSKIRPRRIRSAVRTPICIIAKMCLTVTPPVRKSLGNGPDEE
jgi:hypothetical protein